MGSSIKNLPTDLETLKEVEEEILKEVGSQKGLGDTGPTSLITPETGEVCYLKKDCFSDNSDEMIKKSLDSC